MPTIQLHYAGETININIDAPHTILEPPVLNARDHTTVLDHAIENPINSPKLEDLLKDAEELLVIVNDGTRATPTAQVLDMLSKYIRHIPGIKFMVAVGTHPSYSDEDLERIFGSHLKFIRPRLLVHDSRDPEQLVSIGTTERDNEILLNKNVVSFKKIITISNVEPHYFAGYSGGRKSILPGVAAYDSIERNHVNALSPDSAPLAVHGNPVHEEMAEVVDLLGPEKIFTVQLVLTPEHEIFDAYVGHIHDAFYRAVDSAGAALCTPVEEKADIVMVNITPPKDMNLYQSQHGLENGKLALKEGGIIIWSSGCERGIGNDTFMKLLASADSYDEVADEIRHHYFLGYHKAAKIMQMREWCDIYTVTGIDDDAMHDAKFTTFPDIQTALDDAVKRFREKGIEPNIIVMPKAGYTVPQIDSC